VTRPDRRWPEVRSRRRIPTAGRRRGPGRDESGQALIEFVLVLPVVALIMGVAFNGWNAMQLDIRLTSAARAGAIQAVNDLANHDSQQTAWNDATAAVNAEEGDTNVYQNTNSSAQNYVGLSTTTETTATGIVIHTVTVTISQTSATLVPFVRNLSVNAKATARYS
jgi:Flp pilus assembly protein TadG